MLEKRKAPAAKLQDRALVRQKALDQVAATERKLRQEFHDRPYEKIEADPKLKRDFDAAIGAHYRAIGWAIRSGALPKNVRSHPWLASLAGSGNREFLRSLARADSGRPYIA